MNVKFRNQLLVSVAIILVFNIMNTFPKHWIFTSMGYYACGILWLIRPIPFNTTQNEKIQKAACRIAGVLLIIIGAIFRARYY